MAPLRNKISLTIIIVVMIFMVSTSGRLHAAVKGDLNGDNQINIEDAIIALQICAGTNPTVNVNKKSDINGDQKIGLQEAIYALQFISGLRPPVAADWFNPSYHFVGAFLPGWHWGYGNDFWSRAINDDYIQTARNNGISVVHLMLPSFENNLGVYNEEELIKLDHFLDSASRRGVYAMISFIHAFAIAWQPDDPYYDPRGIEGLMKDERLSRALKNKMSLLINRKNTINGRRYRDDSTVLAWIICDEPISAPWNYPGKPPNVTVPELKNWLEEMGAYIKSLDQNHLVTVFTAAAIDSLKDNDWLKAFNVNSLDFLYAEDADMRILNYFGPDSAKDYPLRLFALNKPVVINLSFTSGAWNQNKICKDYVWQSRMIENAMNSYFEAGIKGVLLSTWGSDLYPSVPSFDQCFNYTASNQPVCQALRNEATKIDP